MIRKNKPKNGKNKENQTSTPQKDYWWNARASIIQKESPDQITNPAGGRPFKFQSPEQLWTACTEYFKWVEDNPLIEDKVFMYKGSITHANLKKMRAMTIETLCLFLGIVPATWLRYQTEYSEEFKLVTKLACMVIKGQKIRGAAAGLLKESIIARELGLPELHEHSGIGGGPIRTQAVPVDLEQLSDKEIDLMLQLAEKVQKM